MSKVQAKSQGGLGSEANPENGDCKQASSILQSCTRKLEVWLGVRGSGSGALGLRLRVLGRWAGGAETKAALRKEQ